jgi:hypothetical protein
MIQITMKGIQVIRKEKYMKYCLTKYQYKIILKLRGLFQNLSISVAPILELFYYRISEYGEKLLLGDVSSS